MMRLAGDDATRYAHAAITGFNVSAPKAATP
jgi:hypothetical protein